MVAPVPRVLTGAGPLHFDHARPELSEDLPGPRPRHDAVQVEHRDPVQRAWAWLADHAFPIRATVFASEARAAHCR
jgi:hypothetical protein